MQVRAAKGLASALCLAGTLCLAGEGVHAEGNVNIGALSEPLAIQPMRFMTARIGLRGSNWFTTGEGQLMAEMAGSGVLDLSQLEPRAFPLDGVNDALEAIKARPGGFVNIVVNPDR